MVWVSRILSVVTLAIANALGHKDLTGALTNKLAPLGAVHLAASAQAMVAQEEDPKTNWLSPFYRLPLALVRFLQFAICHCATI